MGTRRRRLPALLAAGFVVMATLIALSGCGSGGDGGVKTYTDPDYGYSFEYPGDWTLSKSDVTEIDAGAASVNDVSVGDPDGAKVDGQGLDGILVSLYKLNLPVDGSMLPEVRPEVEALFAQFQAQDDSWEILEPLTTTSVAGLPGFKTTCSFDAGDGTAVKCTYYLVFNGDLQYQLALQAAASSWEADQGIFDAFLASFSPGSGT